MAAYQVGTFGTKRVWWACHDLPTYTATELREATTEEQTLMDRVTWNSDTEADRMRLRELDGR